MADLDFPSSPTVGQQYGNWVWNGAQWDFAQTLPGGLPAGAIMAWGGATAPVNWLLCDGSAVSRTTYASLFNAIGTTYGTGDGTTTFNLPDLRGRVPVGKNSGTFGTLGATGGEETHTLTVNEMPSHTHTQNPHNHSMNLQYWPTETSAWDGNISGSRDWAGHATWSTTTASTTATNQNTGGGAAHNNLQPYLVVNYIIKYVAAVTPGESELAPRVGVVEATNTTQNTRLTALETNAAVISGQTGTSTISGAQKISFTDFWVQRGITYDSTTRRFTVPIAGVYRITMNPFQSSGVQTRIYIGINNDSPGGSNHRGHTFTNSTGYNMMNINSVVALAASDYIVFYLAEGALYSASGDTFNQFSIERISA